MNIDYLFRKYTSKHRRLPDFLIIGTQKGGTTSLAHYLSQHSNVFISDIKELHYFNQQVDRPLKEYKHHFPLNISKTFNRNLICGEATPDYMIYPQFASILKKTIPHIKIIVLLKNPAERAFSHYKHNLMMKREWLSFEEALEIEDKRIDQKYIDLFTTKKDAIKNYANYSYRTRGVYTEQIQWLFNEFDRSQIKIILSEDMFANTTEVFSDVLDFLQLEDETVDLFEVKNKSKIKMEFSPETKSSLNDFYRTHNEQLFDLINQRFEWE